MRLMSIGAGSMWLRGFERVDSVGFVQEWRLNSANDQAG
jgi:hypothetical protein